MPGVPATTRKAWPSKQRLTSIDINDLGERLGCRSEVLTSAAQGSEERSGLVGEWDYDVPYQEDLSAALQQFRREVFDAGDYYGHEVGNPLCGSGGRLHGFRQPLRGEPLRSRPRRRALTGRSTDCPTRRKLKGP